MENFKPKSQNKQVVAFETANKANELESKNKLNDSLELYKTAVNILETEMSHFDMNDKTK